MAKVRNKLSLYGDSVSAGPGNSARMSHRAAGRFAGITNFSMGGNTFATNLKGQLLGQPLFNGLDFANHVATADDADIVMFRLGANSVPAGWVSSDPQASLGTDYLDIAAEIVHHVQFAKAAGKRVVMVGTPYVNIQSYMRYYDVTEASAINVFHRTRNVNSHIRMVSALLGVPYIATHGHGGDGLHPPAGAADVPDGVHPSPGYHDAIADYLADAVVRTFGL
jgi:lysophospholipase L1-like esterase